MTCSQVQRHLSPYVDRELPGDIALLVRAHLSRCGECRAELEAYRQVKAALSNLDAVEPPMGLRERLRAAALQDRRRERRAPALGLAAVAACAVLLAFAASHAVDGSPQPVAVQEPPTPAYTDQAYVNSDPFGSPGPILPAAFANR